MEKIIQFENRVTVPVICSIYIYIYIYIGIIIKNRDN